MASLPEAVPLMHPLSLARSRDFVFTNRIATGPLANPPPREFIRNMRSIDKDLIILVELSRHSGLNWIMDLSELGRIVILTGNHNWAWITYILDIVDSLNAILGFTLDGLSMMLNAEADLLNLPRELLLEPTIRLGEYRIRPREIPRELRKSLLGYVRSGGALYTVLDSCIDRELALASRWVIVEDPYLAEGYNELLKLGLGRLSIRDECGCCDSLLQECLVCMLVCPRLELIREVAVE